LQLDALQDELFEDLPFEIFQGRHLFLQSLFLKVLTDTYHTVAQLGRSDGLGVDDGNDAVNFGRGSLYQCECGTSQNGTEKRFEEELIHVHPKKVLVSRLRPSTLCLAMNLNP
jgi:hypothetical protein